MNISVIGTGSWGTALALVLHDNNHKVKCWTLEQDQVDSIRENGENKDFLPGVKFPDSILVTTDMKLVLDDTDIVVSAVPSQVTRKVILKAKELVTEKDSPDSCICQRVHHPAKLYPIEPEYQMQNKNNITTLSMNLL